LHRLGYRAIAGLDEAGRGSWAGPVVAAAVILPRPSRGLELTLRGVRDSKQLSPAQRERLRRVIGDAAMSIGLGVVSAAGIDIIGIAAAGRLAFEHAARALGVLPDYLLTDAFPIPALTMPQQAIVHGDSLCKSIAAASIVAKVERDHMLEELSGRFPEYGFGQHKGYGTAFHARALAEHGPTTEHRYSYAPIRAQLEARWVG
jgi:ribonuclease HII